MTARLEDSAGAARVEVIDARVRLPWDRRPASARMKPKTLTSRYDEVLGTAETRTKSTAELLDELTAAGVRAAVVHAEYEYGDPADELNEAVAELVGEHPDRLHGFGTISLAPLEPLRAVRQTQRVADLGLRGINVQPAFFGLAVDERRLYPVYAKAAELGLVVALHTGVNYSSTSPMELERPALLDRVACDFPGLRLIACHASWPWIPEMVAVARRHRDVYLDFGGLSPRYVGMAGSGWEVLRHFMDNQLREQVLFATDWPVFPIDRAVEEWLSLGLKEATRTALLSGNLMDLVGAPGAAGVVTGRVRS